MNDLHNNYVSLNNNYLEYEELDEWCKDNTYITKYYRHTNKDWSYYLKSLFKWHNETMNIWTHLLGFLSILCSNIYINLNYDVSKYISQTICFNIFTCCMMICYFFSSIMHLLYPKSEKICKHTQFLDYVGINILIASTFATFVYYAFYCDKTIQIIYYTIILIMAIIVIPISKMNIFLISKYRWIRPLVFVIYGSSFLAPIIHRATITEKNDTIYGLELEFFIYAAFSYFTGIIFYGTRFPEKYSKKEFNLIGSSHQLFHIFVLLGGSFTLIGVLKAMNGDNNITC